jgi:DNA-binding MarR family transcriptional regulator
MTNRTSKQLPLAPPPAVMVAPPPAVMEQIRRYFSRRELQGLEAVFALRTTAQQVDNAITEWFAGTVGSPARFQILVLLWAARGSGTPHKEIVATLGVTRATVSGLMAALERDGLVKSSIGLDDRRSLLATLTSKGEAVIEQTIEANRSRLRVAITSLSSAELTTFMTLLQRVRESFAGSANADPAKPQPRRLSVR